MSPPEQAYLIMLAADHRFCLAARELALAAPLELKALDRHDATLRWVCGNDGLIRAAAAPGLCVEVREVSGTAGLACLGRVMQGRLAQHWQRADAALVNALYPKLMLDNTDGRVGHGNPVRVSALSAADAQQWRLRAVGPPAGI
jgi:hypothetical protein